MIWVQDQTVNPGNEIMFTNTYDNGVDFYDPDSIKVEIISEDATVVDGPFDAEIIKLAIGNYKLYWTVPHFLVPGIYRAKWTATNPDTSITTTFERFNVTTFQRAITKNPLEPPQKMGQMFLSASYNIMGVGNTDTIMLIGHGDGIGINTPYQVTSVLNAIRMLGGRAASPLLRGLLEAYYSGARDIWLVAAAPLSEYVEKVADRNEVRSELGGKTFYQKYAERLAVTYSIVNEMDGIDIIVPLEASICDTGGVDFVEPLVFHCKDAFQMTGEIRFGFIGTRTSAWSPTVINDILSKSKEYSLDVPMPPIVLGETIPAKSGAQFVFAHAGELGISLSEMPTPSVSSGSAMLAGILSRAILKDNIAYKLLPPFVSFVTPEFSKAQIDELTGARINPIINQYRRVVPSRPKVLMTDNTLAQYGSDFWSLMQLKLVQRVVKDIRKIGYFYIGTIQAQKFKDDVNRYLLRLLTDGTIKDYNVRYYWNRWRPNLITVELALSPYFGIRVIYAKCEVGPR